MWLIWFVVLLGLSCELHVFTNIASSYVMSSVILVNFILNQFHNVCGSPICFQLLPYDVFGNARIYDSVFLVWSFIAFIQGSV